MSARTALDVGVLGAFPFPLPQGSQVFAAEQARALARAGARVRFFSYGDAEAGAQDPTLRALRRDGVTLCSPLLGVARAPRRAGPSAHKPLADAALLATLLREQRRDPMQIVLAHNVEGVGVALAVRSLGGAPVIYVAHTRMRHELPTYAPRWLSTVAARAGAFLDDAAARHADAVIALTRAAARSLARQARGAVRVLPPGLDAAPAPNAAAIARACAAHGLAPGRFVLHAGNLDAYQDLDVLAATARQIPDVVFAAATHETTRAAPTPLRTVRLCDADDGRALVHAAAVCVIPRRVIGGFPIKLLNYAEAARPIVLRASFADTLVNGESALVLRDDATPGAFAAAIRRLLADPQLAVRIGDAARGVLETCHVWAPIAQATLDVVRSVLPAAATLPRRETAPAR